MASSSSNEGAWRTRIEKTIEFHLHSLRRLSNADPKLKYGRPKPSDAMTVNYSLPRNVTDEMLEQFEEAARMMHVIRQELEVIGMICSNIHGSITHWMNTINDAEEEEDSE